MGKIEVKVNLDLLIVFPDRIRFALSMPDYNDPSVTIQPVSVILPGEAFAIAKWREADAGCGAGGSGATDSTQTTLDPASKKRRWIQSGRRRPR